MSGLVSKRGLLWKTSFSVRIASGDLFRYFDAYCLKEEHPSSILRL